MVIKFPSKEFVSMHINFGAKIKGDDIDWLVKIFLHV